MTRFQLRLSWLLIPLNQNINLFTIFYNLSVPYFKAWSRSHLSWCYSHINYSYLYWSKHPWLGNLMNFPLQAVDSTAPSTAYIMISSSQYILRISVSMPDHIPTFFTVVFLPISEMIETSIVAQWSSPGVCKQIIWATLMFSNA